MCLWTPITVWTTITTTIDLLKTYVARSIDVDFYLYARRIPRTPRDILSCCVACSPDHDNEGVKKYFSDPEYEQVEKSKSLNGIYMGTLMDVGVVGEWKSQSLDPLILKYVSTVKVHKTARNIFPLPNVSIFWRTTFPLSLANIFPIF